MRTLILAAAILIMAGINGSGIEDDPNIPLSLYLFDGADNDDVQKILAEHALPRIWTACYTEFRRENPDFSDQQIATEFFKICQDAYNAGYNGARQYTHQAKSCEVEIECMILGQTVKTMDNNLTATLQEAYNAGYTNNSTTTYCPKTVNYQQNEMSMFTAGAMQRMYNTN